MSPRDGLTFQPWNLLSLHEEIGFQDSWGQDTLNLATGLKELRDKMKARPGRSWDCHC